MGLDQDITISNNMLHKVSKASSSKAAKELRTRAKESPSLLRSNVDLHRRE